MDQNESKMQIAVLIDSENVSSRYASIIFNEIETYGFATYRRIYGNWTKNNGGVEIFFWRIPSHRFSSLTIPRAKILPT